ncbi:MAG: RagB/SusD family nutrient uptake outer membrane protein [Bacteroidetes bacterium]|nr:RagB/SusD family nutrient uptake outer membrane protein [Bacteroidota bacterium]
MKKIFLYLLIPVITLASCNKILDVKPTASISSDIAISSKAGAEHALIGTYNSLQAVGLYGRNFVIVSDLAADNLTWTGTSQDYGQIEKKPVPADNSIVDGFWAASYDGINRANNVLDALPSIKDITQPVADQIGGEALYIRGLLYYNLVLHFGGVPIKTLPTLGLSSIDAKRNTASEVFNQVIADLEEAKNKLSTGKVNGRANSYAASALLAKVYLSKFQMEADQPSAELAIQESTRVIDEGGYSLEPAFQTLFSAGTVSAESIFEVVYDLQNFNRLAQYYYTRNLLGRYEVAPTSGFIQSFETGDLRLAGSVAYDEKNLPYCIKYNDVSGGTDRVYVSRLSDVVLTRAEALAYSGGAVEAIQADVNLVRNRAGLANTEFATIDDLKLAIENERRHEFAFEGQRWIDLVRTGRAKTVLGIDAKYTLFPIPLSEMQTNKLMEQNPGY